MKTAKFVATISLLAMTAVLVYAFTVGSFAEDGAKLIANPWGIVSLVDLYAGFLLFSAWIVFREKDLLPKILWVVLMMVLGFFTAALYTLIAIYKSDGDWLSFFLGSRKKKILKTMDASSKNKGTKA